MMGGATRTEVFGLEISSLLAASICWRRQFGGQFGGSLIRSVVGDDPCVLCFRLLVVLGEGRLFRVGLRSFGRLGMIVEGAIE
jgi:hypothetical protein